MRLNRFDEERGTFEHFQHDASDPKSLSNPHVWDILEDREGQLWLTTFGGVNRYEYATGRFIRYEHNPDDESSIGHNIVWPLYEDRSGTLWVGTEGGLSRYDRARDQFRTFRHDEQDSTSLSNNGVRSLFEDRHGRLWVGTSGGGLNLFDRQTETFTAFRTRDGLPNDWVSCILEDDQGNLWLGTKGGLSKFDPLMETFANYDKSDGLLTEPFNRNACLKSPEGHLFFGGCVLLLKVELE